MNMTLFRLKTSSYPLNYFGQGMTAATPCHMGSSATDTSLFIYITRRLTSHPRLINSWLAYLQKMDNVYLNEPFVPALMKMFSFITDRYRTSIHTILTVWTTLSIRYRDSILTKYRRRRGIKFPISNHYSPYNQPMVGIWTAAQVGHCLSSAFGSLHRWEGQTLLAD
jgi:hypothetical protein